MSALSLKGIKKSYKKSHFSSAFFFLPKPRKRALSLLYEVCRVLDDAVDLPDQKNPSGFLEDWKTVFLHRKTDQLKEFGYEDLAKEFLKAAETYQIPLFAMVDLIEKGVAVDLNKNRFETAMETESYCYGVAGTVGMACLPIFGVPLDEAKDFGIRLGITVQWINLIRDVGVDARLGRIYLPLDHCEQFGYTEQDFMNGVENENFQRLIQFEAGVARQHFRRAQELMPKKWHKELLPARIMGRTYMEMLQKIEIKGFPVYREKIRLNLIEKGNAIIKEIKNKEWQLHT